MSRNSKNVMVSRKRRKELLVALLGGKCQICGFDSFIEAFDFHHDTKRYKKSYGICSGNTHDIISDIEEARKCYLLCARCHQGVHGGHITQPKEHVFNLEAIQDYLNTNGISVDGDNIFKARDA